VSLFVYVKLPGVILLGCGVDKNDLWKKRFFAFLSAKKRYPERKKRFFSG
jgi:hypothetical protein